LRTNELVAIVQRLAHRPEDGLVEDGHQEQELGGDDGQGEIEIEQFTRLGVRGRDERGGLRGERERRKLDAVDRGRDLRLGRGDGGGGGLLRRRRLGDDGDVRASAGGHEGHDVGRWR